MNCQKGSLLRVLAGLAACVAWVPVAIAAAQPLVVGYYLATPAPARYVAPDKLPAAKLTHLNYAFANIAGGEIVVGDPALDTSGPNNFARLRQLKKRYPKLKTLISVGGWAWSGNFSDAALTPQSRARFAASGVAFIREHGFDGIDIDWEFPVAGGMPTNVRRPEDKQNFTLLLQALREQLDAAGRADHRKYLLTAAVGNNEGYLYNTEIKSVAATLDWLNLMAYDMNGIWNKLAAHLAPLYRDPAMAVPNANPKNNVADLVERYLATGVQPKQIVLGVPFYGYSWAKCGALQHGEYQLCEGPGHGSWEDGALDYSEIELQLVNRNGYVRYWNASSKAPFLFNAASGEFISYEDPESLRAKVRFVKQRKLAGMMFWELTGDRKQVLLSTLWRELQPPPPPRRK